MVIAKRARSREQKGERRQEILSAARELFQEKTFRAINIDAIARKAGMAKGTIFLYFKTKEELFLTLTSEEFKNMFDALEEKLAAWDGSRTRLSKIEVMDMLQKVLSQRETLVRLIAIQHIILEQNIQYAEALEFKRALTRRVLATGAWFDRLVPFFAAGQGARFIMWMYAFVIGFSHVAEPAPVIQKVYQREPELRKLALDFEQEFFAALSAVWDGWQAEAKTGKGLGRRARHEY